MAAVVALPVLCSPLQAQRLRQLLPEANLAPTIRADPRAPAMGAKLIMVVESATLFGTGLEGEADAGTSFPLLLLSGETADHAVVLGIQAGVFGRFVMETKTRDLVSTDWVFGLPLFIWRGDNWFRFRYRHFSSHLGDEYIELFGATRADYTRDGLGFMAYRQVTPKVGLYGGGDVAFNVDPDDAKRIALQAGIELNETPSTGASQPYGGVDVLLAQDTSWRPRVNLQSGVRLVPQSRRSLRLVFEWLFGPSPQGEFHQVDETLVSLGLVLEM